MDNKKKLSFFLTLSSTFLMIFDINQSFDSKNEKWVFDGIHGLFSISGDVVKVSNFQRFSNRLN
jgi:hypothetical protein